MEDSALGFNSNGSGSALASQLSSIPLYAGLDEQELADVAIGLRLLEFNQGDTIVRQGAKADGVYFILQGKAQVTIALPGGGAEWVAELSEGNLFGELAMIRGAPRNATVIATSPVHAVFTDWRFLTAALGQLRSSAFKVFRNLLKILAGRVRAINERIRLEALPDSRPYELLRFSSISNFEGVGSANFDVRPFLPILPCFRNFDPGSIELLSTQAKLVEYARGTELIKFNAPADRAYIVVRGAVASGFSAEQGIHLISVRGPGSFCNTTSMIDLLPSSSAFVVCEAAVLLELETKQFGEFIGGTNITSYAFLNAILEHQATSLSRAVNHFKRIAGLARVISQFRTASGTKLSLDIG